MEYCCEFYKHGKPYACGRFPGSTEYEARALARDWFKNRFPALKYDRMEVWPYGGERNQA